MAGKGKHGLDRLFQEQGESHSRRTLMESWTLEQDEHLFVGINKYRRYGFSVEATMELMKKDVAFHTIFSDWPISVMVARFEALVAERRILPLVTNSDVVQWADLKGGESEGSGEGEGESASLGRLAVQFLDLACSRLAAKLNKD